MLRDEISRLLMARLKINSNRDGLILLIDINQNRMSILITDLIAHIKESL